MKTPSAKELLYAWERCAGRPPLQRALVLLEAAADTGDADPAAYSIGERDRRLLELRESLFGQEMTAVATCKECSGRVEVAFQVRDVLFPTTHTTLRFSSGDYALEARLPNSTDLIELQSGPAGTTPQPSRLLARCLLRAERAGQAIAAEALPEEIRAVVSERMAEADPQAQVVLKLQCDRCGHAWREDFHIDAFLWSEVNAWAGRLLNEVHQLACAYGWSETQILELGPLRRNLYLNLVAE
jgi:hypothetical protein